MSEEFTIAATMTKAQLMEEHERLFNAYRVKLKEATAARDATVAAEGRARALAVAREATVEGVIEGIGQLRGQTGKTLNELLEQMTAQSERLTALNRAVEAQEIRLAELNDVAAAARSLESVVQVYDQRRQAADEEYASQVARLEESFRQRSQELEAELGLRRSELEKAIAEQRSLWKADKEKTAREQVEAAERQARARQREEEEYVYQRDRERKIADDRFADESAERERKLARLKQETELELAAREAAVTARESELEQLKREVETLPRRIESERKKAADEAAGVARTEASREHELAAVQREWEAKMLQERISSLERELASRDAKLKDLKADLDAALKQGHLLATKALDRPLRMPPHGGGEPASE